MIGIVVVIGLEKVLHGVKVIAVCRLFCRGLLKEVDLFCLLRVGRGVHGCKHVLHCVEVVEVGCSLVLILVLILSLILGLVLDGSIIIIVKKVSFFLGNCVLDGDMAMFAFAEGVVICGSDIVELFLVRGNCSGDFYRC